MVSISTSGQETMIKSSRSRCCSIKSFFKIIFILLLLLIFHVFVKNSGHDSGDWSFLQHSRSLFYSGFTEHKFPEIIYGPQANHFTSIIVMSSNPRTGSSYTGEMLSAAPDSAYFFEPLWYYVDTKNSKPPSMEDKKTLIMNLLKCNFHDPRIKKMIFSNRQSTFVFRKPSLLGLRYDRTRIGRMGFLKRLEIKCKKSKIRVIKTIRMNMAEMSSLLDQLPDEGRVSRKNFHVVYLARDPRGVINSIKTLKEQWPDKFLSPNHICSRMFNDSTIISTTNKENNLLVLKYEDIVRKPEEQLSKISERFNISVGGMENFLQRHNSAKWKDNKKDSSKSAIQKKVDEVDEDPMKFIVSDLAKQQEFKADTELKEDVKVYDDNTESSMELSEIEEGSGEEFAGTDYYDSKGKLMTVRRKRSIMKKSKKGVESDPEGRSYYFSTYRRNNFDPEHWRRTLPKSLLDAVLREETCTKILHYFGYSN